MAAISWGTTGMKFDNVGAEDWDREGRTFYITVWIRAWAVISYKWTNYWLNGSLNAGVPAAGGKDKVDFKCSFP